MAQLDVEPKKNNDWWKWLLGILAAILIIWAIMEAMSSDDAVDDVDDIETATESPTTTYLEPDDYYTYS